MLNDGFDARSAQPVNQGKLRRGSRNAAKSFNPFTESWPPLSDRGVVSGTALRLRCIAPVAFFVSCSAHAHGGTTLTESSLWLMLLSCAPMYALGAARLWRQSGRGRGLTLWQTTAACSGWLALVAALAPPLEELAEVSFAAHMVQHEVLMLVAAPLLVVGKPLAAFTWSLPLVQRHAVSRPFRSAWFRRGWRYLVMPPAAWSVHTLVLWSWHTPAWFEAGLRNGALHDLQHASFFASALLFWWALLRRRPDGIAVLYVLTTLLHTGLLGALLTFAPSVWYATYAGSVNPWGLTALADQQLGGLIMWIPAGAILMFAGLLLLAQWLQTLERRAPIGWPARKNI